MNDLQKVADNISRELQKIDNETLDLIFKDHKKALEYVKKGMQAVGTKDLTKAEINSLAYEMQAVARMLLKERAN